MEIAYLLHFPAFLLFCPRHQTYALNVVRAAEHVDGLYFFCLVAVFVQVGQVAGEGGRVARDVDDAFGFALGNGGENRFTAAGAWRVEDDDVRADAVADELGQLIDGVAEDELRVFDVVVLGVADGVADGRGDDFNAEDFFGFLGQKEGDRTSATVDVDDSFAAFEVGKVQGRFVEALGLFTIDLEEGLGRDVEGQGADGVVDRVLAVDKARLRAKDDIRMTRVYVLDDARKSRNLAAQHADQVLHVRYLVDSRDQADHDFARMDADAAHDVTDNTCAQIFVVGRDFIILHPLAYDAGNDVVLLFLDSTIFDVDDLVCRCGKAADGDVVFAYGGDRELHFIAVVPRCLSAEGRQNGNLLEVANTFDSVLDLLAFFLQFAFIGHVLELAAATAVVDRTFWFDAVR